MVEGQKCKTKEGQKGEEKGRFIMYSFLKYSEVKKKKNG